MSTTAATATTNYCCLSSILIEDQMTKLPILKPDSFLNDSGLFAVYCFVKNFIG